MLHRYEGWRGSAPCRVWGPRSGLKKKEEKKKKTLTLNEENE